MSDTRGLGGKLSCTGIEFTFTLRREHLNFEFSPLFFSWIGLNSDHFLRHASRLRLLLPFSLNPRPTWADSRVSLTLDEAAPETPVRVQRSSHTRCALRACLFAGLSLPHRMVRRDHAVFLSVAPAPRNVRGIVGVH